MNAGSQALLNSFQSFHCNYCKRKRLALKVSPRFMFHGMLVVLTCGMWAIPALFYLRPSWRCSSCGGYVG